MHCKLSRCCRCCCWIRLQPHRRNVFRAWIIKTRSCICFALQSKYDKVWLVIRLIYKLHASVQFLAYAWWLLSTPNNVCECRTGNWIVIIKKLRVDICPHQGFVIILTKNIQNKYTTIPLVCVHFSVRAISDSEQELLYLVSFARRKFNHFDYSYAWREYLNISSS